VAIISLEYCLLFDSNLFPASRADLMPVSHIVICVVNVQASRNGIRVCDLVNNFDVFSEKYALPLCVVPVEFNCYVIVISLSTVEYTSVSRVYSTVDSDITNLIQDPSVCTEAQRSQAARTE